MMPDSIFFPTLYGTFGLFAIQVSHASYATLTSLTKEIGTFNQCAASSRF
jgi:hypothetical protein